MNGTCSLVTDQPEIPCSSNNGSAQRPKCMAKMNGEDRGPRVAVQKHANSLQKIQKSLKRNLDCGKHPFEQKSPSTLRLRQKNPPCDNNRLGRSTIMVDDHRVNQCSKNEHMQNFLMHM